MTTPGGRMKRPSFDPFEVLKLEPGCSERDIDKAYKKYALQWHPDKNPDRVEKANEMFRRIYEAYMFLKDHKARKELEEEVLAKKRRVEYDIERRQATSKRRQEFLDKLKRTEAAAAAEKPAPATTQGWRDNRRSAEAAWATMGGSVGGSSKSNRSSNRASAKWDVGDDEELEKLKREGAEMLRRDREEAERRMRADSVRMKREAERHLQRQSRDFHPSPAAEQVASRGGYFLDAGRGDLNRTGSSAAAMSHPSPAGSQFDMSLDDFLKFEQEVLNYSSTASSDNDKPRDEDGAPGDPEHA